MRTLRRRVGLARAAAFVLVVGCGEAEAPPADATPQEDSPSRQTAEPPLGPVLPPAGRKVGWPVQSVHITSYFGWRTDPVSGAGTRLHKGVDFRGAIGEFALSIADGTVEFVGHDPLLGNLVIVDHGDGIRSLYGHLSGHLVAEGMPLARGAAVGLIGNTGRSAAPHLHLTVKIDDVAIDPLLLIGQPLHRPEAAIAQLAPAKPPPPQPSAQQPGE